MTSTKNKCYKKHYLTKEEALEEAKEYNKKNCRKGNYRKLRFYFCESCECYHLTSMPISHYKWLTDSEYRKEKSKSNRLKREVEYWTNKLKL